MSNVPATVNDISREDVVLKRIFEDPVIQNRIISHLSSDLFEDTLNRGVCKIILQYYNKYSKFPNMQELTVSMPHCAERNKIIALGNFKLESIDDIQNPLIKNWMEERGIQSSFAFPIKTLNDGIVGMLCIDFTKKKSKLNKDQIHLLQNQSIIIGGYLI